MENQQPPEVPGIPPRPDAPPPAARPSGAGFPDVPPPAQPPQVQRVDVRVDKRLLWVGEAVYPLENITRVYTFVLRPRRRDAVMAFLKQAAALAGVSIGLGLISLLSAFVHSDAVGGFLTLVWLCVVAGGIYFFVEMLQVLTAPSHPALGVETSGPSAAVVTSRDFEALRQLAVGIADAIENPQAHFLVRMDSIPIRPDIYHFGDNVNIYGGTGNVGIKS